MSVINVDVNNFKEVTSEGLVLVDFWASWCGPCKMLAPTLDELAEDFGDKVKIVKINVDEDKNQSVAQEYGVMGLPTLMLFKDGNVLDTKSGLLPKEALEEWVNEHK